MEASELRLELQVLGRFRRAIGPVQVLLRRDLLRVPVPMLFLQGIPPVVDPVQVLPLRDLLRVPVPMLPVLLLQGLPQEDDPVLPVQPQERVDVDLLVDEGLLEELGSASRAMGSDGMVRV